MVYSKVNGIIDSSGHSQYLKIPLSSRTVSFDQLLVCCGVNHMQSTGLMFTIAQIAVGLAGFSAIIVTLNAKPIREWDDTDRLNLRLLIQISIYVIFFSLLPPMLAIPFAPHLVWMYGLWAYGLIQ